MVAGPVYDAESGRKLTKIWSFATHGDAVFAAGEFDFGPSARVAGTLTIVSDDPDAVVVVD